MWRISDLFLPGQIVVKGSRKFYCAVKSLGIMSCKNKVTNERQNLAFCFDYSIKNSLLTKTQASALGIP